MVAITDPEETRDSLRFDRTVESVQTAAESLGYRLDRYWIPWTPQVGSEPVSEESKKPKDEPGMLLFRSKAYEKVLVVFLVGESPIFGIRLSMFQNALYYQKALLGAVPSDFYVAGPNYSGSFSSLTKAINDATALFPKVAQIFHVISPSATVLQAGEAFRKSADYSSVVHNDEYAVWKHFKDYVMNRWGYNLGIAVLSESGTEFGASFLRGKKSASEEGKKNDNGLRIRFPREIARLRNAYPDPAGNILLRDESQQSQPERLQVPLKDTRVRKDSVPTFATKQIPVSQEAVLLEIASILRSERAAFVNIVSTDVFDSIFLCSYLRRACPEIRLFYANADMLFIRSVENQPLEGILSVTTFPLFLRNQFWSPRRNNEGVLSLNPMASRCEFGIYNACVTLLLNQEGRTEDTLLEYSWEQQNYLKYPPLWLTAVGANGYWPIALLDSSEPKAIDPLLWQRQSGKKVGVGMPNPGNPTQLWFYVFGLLVSGCIIFCTFVVLAQILPQKAWPGFYRLIAGLKVSPQVTGVEGRAFFLMTGSLFLGIMVFIMASPVWIIARGGVEACWIRRTVWTSAVAVLLAICAAMMQVALTIVARHLACHKDQLVRAARASLENGKGLIHPFASQLKEWLMGTARAAKSVYLWLMLLSLAFVIWFVSLWWMEVLNGGKNYEGFFFAYRSLDLVNGLSPGLPFLLLAGVILLLSYLHSRRHALYLETPERLPSLGNEEEAKSISLYVEMVADPLAHPLLSRQAKGIFLFVLGASFIFFLQWAKPLSLESRQYDLLYHISFRLVVGLIVLSWTRFLLSWSSLRMLLDRLDRHPLRDAFVRMPPLYSTSPILPGKGLHIVEDSIRKSASILGSLLRQSLGVEFRKSLEKKQNRLHKEIDGHLARDAALRASDIGTLSMIHSLLTETGELIVAELEKFWQKSCVEIRGLKKDSSPSEIHNLPLAASLGEEFVALQYATFIGIVMQQLRNLLYFVTTSFFLAIVSALVYPFRSSNQFMWTGTVAFFVLGTPVILALVQIERNEGLKRLTSREEGNIGRTFLRFVSYGALPLLGLISSHFPALGRYLVSLLQPAMQALR